MPAVLAVLLLLATPALSAPLSPLDKAWSKIASPGPNLGSREIMGFILEAADCPDYQARAPQIEQAFVDLERMQDRNPAAKTYGNLCWYWHEKKPGDRNAVEFVTQQAVLLRLHPDHLSPAALASLDRLLTYAIEGIHRQRVDVGYTNIFLMKTWNMLALGQAFQKPDLTQEGSAMLDQWIAFTRTNGIREYLSPTYYSVDLDSLALMAKFLPTDNPSRAKATRILQLFWADIAANWFDPAGRLGGAHGRDYDYLTGHGELDRHLRDAGWIPGPGTAPPFRVFAQATLWIPTPNPHHQAVSDIPRFVFQKWDAPDNAWASQYAGHQFSIGVSGSSQGPEDKPFALNLASPAGPKTVMVNFFMDGRNDPYGKIKAPTGASGHSKAHHLFPFFSAVQRGPEVLFLAASPLAGHKPETIANCLLSHMDLPAEAQVWIGDQQANPKLASQPVPGNICFLRIGDVAVGIHFVLALDTTGRPTISQVVNDGAAYDARRLTVTHSTTPPGTSRGVVAIYVRAAEGLDDAAFASFRRAFIDSKTASAAHGDTVHVEAAGLQSTLSLDADLAAGKLLETHGSDPAMETAPMSVDGKDFSAEILK